MALVVTPEGLPLAYEMFPGNTADKTTLRDLLQLIQKRYGNAERIRVMDRGIPTETVLAELRQSDAKVSCLVGTPKGRLTKLEQDLGRQTLAASARAPARQTPALGRRSPGPGRMRRAPRQRASPCGNGPRHWPAA